MRFRGVKSTIRDGEFDFRRIEPHRYSVQRDKFHDDFGIWLPELHELEKMGKELDQLHLLLSEIYILVEYENTFFVEYIFHPGFITDLASVPKFFRGAIDNDELLMLEAVLPHDFNYQVHPFTVQQTNDMFREMLVDEGVGRFKARVAYWSVNGIVGRSIYHNPSPEYRDWCLDTVSINVPKPLQHGVLKGESVHHARLFAA